MPNVIATPRSLRNGEVITEFTDTTSTTAVTHTYPLQQSGISIENSGAADIFVTVGTYTNQVVNPKKTWKADAVFTSFSIRSDANSQEFTATAFQNDTEGSGEADSGMISTISAQLNRRGLDVTDRRWGAKGDGVADDTAAIQKAINAANAWTDASAKGLRNFPLSMLYRGGIVFLPPGIYNVTTLNMKSGVILRGAGVYATRLNPIGTSGFVIGRDSVEEWLSCIGYEDFTIAPTDEHFAFTTKYATPPSVGGINFTLTSQAYVNRVNIVSDCQFLKEVSLCH